jgi:ATP-dependent RNA helicase RhlE
LTDTTFAELGVAQPLLQALEAENYHTPTPIQTRAIPALLDGRDMLGVAQTGTGKTAAFTLPMLQILSRTEVGPKKGRRPRCLVLTPTRELAAQIAESVDTYGAGLQLRSTVIFGGVGINPQIDTLRRGVDILIATPGRLLDHAGRPTVDLSKVEILVLDEADRMLDMGFIHDIKRVLKFLPKRRQNLLFSATYTEEVKKFSDALLHSPVLIEVARRNTAAELVSQVVHPVGRTRKRELLSHIIKEENWNQALVFTRTKHGANRLSKQLVIDGISATAIHGNKSQAARTKALADFKRGQVRVLVATDVAARGLDIDRLPHVVNFDLPHVPEDYVHRIGRTGRAGVSGRAVSLVSADERLQLKNIERLLKRAIEVEVIPGFKQEKTPPKSQASTSPEHASKDRHGGRPQRATSPKSTGRGTVKSRYKGSARTNESAEKSASYKSKNQGGQEKAAQPKSSSSYVSKEGSSEPGTGRKRFFKGKRVGFGAGRNSRRGKDGGRGAGRG